jgi:hypothetical protein
MEEETQPVQQKCDQGWRLATAPVTGTLQLLGGSQPSAATAWKKWGKTQDKSKNLASASHWAIIPLAHGFSISICLYLYHISYLTFTIMVPNIEMVAMENHIESPSLMNNE